MKTIIIYNQLDQNIQYLIVEGDFSRFNGAAINSCMGNGFEGEFVEWFYESGTGKNNFQMSENSSILESKEWDKIAIVTWLP